MIRCSNYEVPDQSGATDDKVQVADQDFEHNAAARVWQVVALIPAGKVATYGQIAAMIGLPTHARFIGSTLKKLPEDSGLPWHRVVNAQLRISLSGSQATTQATRLQDEGIGFQGSRIAQNHLWQP
jgi:methylated-DNA-protein-cysteine methyltransferase-like protein